MSEAINGITINVGDDGIAVLELKQEGKVNKIGEPFIRALTAGVEQLGSIEGLKGVIVTTGHKDFCVGADLEFIFAERDPNQVFEGTRILNATFRKLETLGVPVVAALTGSALGGGFEIALACHHRIALNSPKIQLGLPEVALGVIPGGGGTQRLPYIMGIQAALEHMATAQPVRAPKALKAGMIDALAETPEALLEQARAWIAENPKVKQPWDQERWSWPGGARPNTPAAMQLFVGAAAFLYKKTAGAYPAAEGVLKAVADGTRLSFERGLEVEGRIFARLATGDNAKDMIRTFWFHRNAAERRGVGLEHGFQKVTVLGAGMMGAGLAFLCAKTGCDVVLKDISEEQLEAAKKHCAKQAGKLRHLSKDDQAALVDRIAFTLDNGPIEGSDLIIEAIVENKDIKHAITKELEPMLAPNGVWASNTSAIPIGTLAEASAHPERFVGMHFFSPVEKMPLLEIIQPEGCSDETVNRALAFGKALKKTNIVVNDGYGFYTSRFFAAYLLEGCELVAEGHDPALVEYAARTCGMVMPPLKVFDEVTLTLGCHAFDNQEAFTGRKLDAPGITLVKKLVELGRKGKSSGQGFYDWDTRTIWSGLKDLVDATPEETGLEHLQRRIMVGQAAEIARILEDGIIRDNLDVEIGAIFGLGFAPNSGGPLAWMDRQGLRELVTEMRQLADRYSPRYAPTASLVEMAEKGERFWPEV